MFESLATIDPLGIIAFLLFIAIMLLLIYLLKKGKRLSILEKELIHQDRIIKNLDQQAKLIIKSDMEVKLYQQEIESELRKLTMIRNLISSSVHILDKETLVSQVDSKVVEALGFKRGLVLDFNTLAVRANIGLSAKEIESVKNVLQYKKEAFKETQLLRQDSEIQKQLQVATQSDQLMVATIRSREQTHSIFLVSELLTAPNVSKSEGEAFVTICSYLSQCLNNIQLFEELYHTKDDLEKKIKERTSELVKSLRAVETISKSKTDFVSSVSHELRTPLTSVKGFSSLLIDEKFGKLPKEARDRLIKIDTNVDKLMDIVNILLDISRIESGKTETHIISHEIVKIITEVTDFLTPQTQSKGIKFAFDLPKQLKVYMDKTLIERVFINLINNAIKFTGSDGEIKISCKEDADQVIISVADTGCGIKKDHLEKVFQEFFTVANPVNQGAKGSGLGLSLVKKIIDIHKGKIWIESEVDKGTTFYFTLKVAKNV
ncbi:MAG: HAMP domain-containing histidine kinase [Candidatus Omnitrophica bacterium]|nr:HAMP domain-containing histidine kinase [Candidatus Omnitrophota bacterium]